MSLSSLSSSSSSPSSSSPSSSSSASLTLTLTSTSTSLSLSLPSLRLITVFPSFSASWRVLADFYFAQSSVQLHLSKISSVQSFLSFGQFHSLLRIKLLHFLVRRFNQIFALLALDDLICCSWLSLRPIKFSRFIFMVFKEVWQQIRTSACGAQIDNWPGLKKLHLWWHHKWLFTYIVTPLRLLPMQSSS